MRVEASIGPGVLVHAMADTATAILGGGSLQLDGVHAECTATLEGATGTASIARLLSDGEPQLDLAPAPNTTIPLPGGMLVLNEQFQENEFSITVNAVHLYLGPQEVVVSSVTCVLDPIT